jgi:hypothetical protein
VLVSFFDDVGRILEVRPPNQRRRRGTVSHGSNEPTSTSGACADWHRRNTCSGGLAMVQGLLRSATGEELWGFALLSSPRSYASM